MSSDIYAKPDLSKKVRYNRKEQEDNVQWEEREVDIYESADAIRDDLTAFQSNSRGLHTEERPPAVHRRSFWAAAICLGVLCFLSLIGNILQFLSHISVTLEKDQIVGRLSDVAVNNSQLQSSYETLSKNHDQLQDEVKQLKDKIEGKWCPVRWKRFGCSCYFKSNEMGTWEESRKQCQDNGADLVVINNKEEQEFVIQLNQKGESWVGLSRKWTGTGWSWQWVDGSPLTETFWASGQDSWYATCCNLQGKWTGTDDYYGSKYWICEK